MDIKDILLPLSPGRDDRAAIALAGRLGLVHGARVEGLCLTPVPALHAEDCYAVGGLAVRDVLHRMDQDVAASRAGVEAQFRAAMRAAGCALDWSATSPGELAAETALRARLCDLVVLTRPARQDAAALAIAETLVRLGGAPCLLVPPGPAAPPPFDHVAVGWNGSRQSKRALDDALPFLAAASRITVLYAGAAEGREAHHEALLAHLDRKGLSASLEVLAKGSHGAGRPLLDWCGAWRADLLVMGAFGHTPRAEQWLGGATWTALVGAELPVLLSC